MGAQRVASNDSIRQSSKQQPRSCHEPTAIRDDFQRYDAFALNYGWTAPLEKAGKHVLYASVTPSSVAQQVAYTTSSFKDVDSVVLQRTNKYTERSDTLNDVRTVLMFLGHAGLRNIS
jgi:hypothetical protein